jgi:hypothetical protein
MGAAHACDTPVIEMIAKPVLPREGFGDTDWQATCKILQRLVKDRRQKWR